ncbi:putative mitogen-activated protein kinase kinase kinase STE-STE11 family [Helianthus annuus]|nr:putative mitogen-activated protein kinase kinase kinase STE-STE11 family [Helianthus annuus]
MHPIFFFIYPFSLIYDNILNILKIWYKQVDDKRRIYLEYISGGSLRNILNEYGPLGEQAIRSYTQQILSGLSYLHATNTVYTDIKGGNILVDPNGWVKLADFGMAKHVSRIDNLLGMSTVPVRYRKKREKWIPVRYWCFTRKYRYRKTGK